jgi:hypothetical protein
MMMFKYEVRAYIYRVSLALIPLFILWGVLGEAEAPIYLAAIAGLLDVGLAVRHTPLQDEHVEF